MERMMKSVATQPGATMQSGCAMQGATQSLTVKIAVDSQKKVRSIALLNNRALQESFEHTSRSHLERSVVAVQTPSRSKMLHKMCELHKNSVQRREVAVKQVQELYTLRNIFLASLGAGQPSMHVAQSLENNDDTEFLADSDAMDPLKNNKERSVLEESDEMDPLKNNNEGPVLEASDDTDVLRNHAHCLENDTLFSVNAMNEPKNTKISDRTVKQCRVMSYIKLGGACVVALSFVAIVATVNIMSLGMATTVSTLCFLCLYHSHIGRSVKVVHKAVSLYMCRRLCNKMQKLQKEEKEAESKFHKFSYAQLSNGQQLSAGMYSHAIWKVGSDYAEKEGVDGVKASYQFSWSPIKICCKMLASATLSCYGVSLALSTATYYMSGLLQIKFCMAYESIYFYPMCMTPISIGLPYTITFYTLLGVVSLWLHGDTLVHKISLLNSEYKEIFFLYEGMKKRITFQKAMGYMSELYHEEQCHALQPG